MSGDLLQRKESDGYAASGQVSAGDKPPTSPDPREDPNSRSLKGVPIKYPLVVKVPKFGDLRFRSLPGVWVPDIHQADFNPRPLKTPISRFPSSTLLPCFLFGGSLIKKKPK